MSTTDANGDGVADSVKVTGVEYPPVDKCDVETQVMHRLYNRISQEHLYTADTHERDVLSKGDWTYEGVAWISPAESNTPVYRLYNPILGNHHYTTDKHEVDALTAEYNWNYEGIGWYVDDCKRVPVWRQFTPLLRVGSHHYTADKHEYDTWVATGVWNGEGIGWYVISWK